MKRPLSIFLLFLIASCGGGPGSGVTADQTPLPVEEKPLMDLSGDRSAPLTDIAGHPYEEEIRGLVDSGYWGVAEEATQFSPDLPISLDEEVRAIVKASGLSAEADQFRGGLCPDNPVLSYAIDRKILKTNICPKLTAKRTLAQVVIETGRACLISGHDCYNEFYKLSKNYHEDGGPDYGELSAPHGIADTYFNVAYQTGAARICELSDPADKSCGQRIVTKGEAAYLISRMLQLEGRDQTFRLPESLVETHFNHAKSLGVFAPTTDLHRAMTVGENICLAMRLMKEEGCLDYPTEVENPYSAYASDPLSPNYVPDDHPCLPEWAEAKRLNIHRTGETGLHRYTRRYATSIWNYRILRETGSCRRQCGPIVQQEKGNILFHPDDVMANKFSFQSICAYALGAYPLSERLADNSIQAYSNNVPELEEGIISIYRMMQVSPPAEPETQPEPVEVQTFLKNGAGSYEGTSDTFISSIDWTWVPETEGNFGGSSAIRVFAVDGRNGLIRFDVSHIPEGAQILEAKLSLFLSQNEWATGAPFELLRATTAWEEGSRESQYDGVADGATWLIPWSTPGGDYAESVCTLPLVLGQFSVCDITPLVQSWVSGEVPNFGLVIRGTDPNGDDARFISSENSDVSKRPSLEIRYLSSQGGEDPPPPLPPPSPPPPPPPQPGAQAGFCPIYSESPIYRSRARQVVVGPTDDWKGAIINASNGTEVILRAGNYDLDASGLWLGVGDITIRGETGNADDVVIRGRGYATGDVEAFVIAAPGITIADLSITRVRNHGISLKGESNADNAHMYNVHLSDIGTQEIKMTAGGTRDVVIACSRMGYSVGAVRGDYIGGIDLHTCNNCQIRDNLLYNFVGDGSGCEVDIDCGTYTSGPAILVWNNSTGTIIERNTLIGNFRNIALGLGRGHEGGIVRNNILYRSQSGDAGIELQTANNVHVLHNTIFAFGYPGGIEIRDSAGVVIQSNLVNASIWNRGNASFSEDGNRVDLTQAKFQPFSFDYNRPANFIIPRVIADASLINACTLSPHATTDIDGQLRDVCHIGADHFSDAAPPSPPPPPPPGDQALLSQEDFEYLGAFRLPRQGNNGTDFTWGGWAMGLRVDGDPGGAADGFSGSLFIVGHDYQQMVAEVDIPIPRDPAQVGVSALNTARYLQPFTDITAGIARSLDQGNGYKINGLAYLPLQGNQSGGGKLYWTARPYYNVSFENHASHGMSSADFGNLDVKGPWRLGGEHPLRTAGYILEIPRSFADAFLGGKILASGLFTHQGIAGTSAGPAMYAYAPWLDDPAGVAPSSGTLLSVTPLVFYPCNPNGFGCDSTFLRYRDTDGWNAASWISTPRKHGIVVVGQRAGSARYGGPQPGDCSPYQGYHGDPYEPSFVFYSPRDLEEVVAGRKNPSDVQPYAEWNPRQFFVATCEWEFSGAGFDPATRLFYVLHRQADTVGGGPQPLVHVFRVRE